MPVVPSDAATPPVSRFLAEVPAFFRRPFWAPACRRVARAHRGDGRTVMVIPGFLANDVYTLRLRRTLEIAGYAVTGWELGTNRGVHGDMLERLTRRLDALARDNGPVVVIGWSLGGLYARELAKRLPHRTDRVLTLGSPFHGDLRANHAWRLYEFVNRHPVDAPPLKVDLPAKPPVPTYAFWSPRDGIVAPAATRGLPGESDVQVRVDCAHMAFCSHPEALEKILGAISDPPRSARTAPPPPPAP